MSLPRLLAALADSSRRHAILVMLAGLLLAALCCGAAALRLGVSTDTDELFASSLPWRQRELAMNQAFPQFKDLLVAVIDGSTPEDAEQTATDLARALAPDTTHFLDVRRPDASP
jgi:hypothetical protein